MLFELYQFEIEEPLFEIGTGDLDSHPVPEHEDTAGTFSYYKVIFLIEFIIVSVYVPEGHHAFDFRRIDFQIHATIG